MTLRDSTGQQATITAKVAARIRSLRREQGLSAQKVADRIGSGLSRSTLTKIELGLRSSIELEELEAIAGALRLLPEELIQSAMGRSRDTRVVCMRPRITRFEGPQETLNNIRKGLLDRRTFALTGPAGTGKSRVADEYIYQFGHLYEIVWWVAAINDAAIREQIGALAKTAGWVRGNAPEALKVQAARTQLAARTGWLLVFDGARRPGDLIRLLNQDAGHVLITSGDSDWNDIAVTVSYQGRSNHDRIRDDHQRRPPYDNARDDHGEMRAGMPARIDLVGKGGEARPVQIQTPVSQRAPMDDTSAQPSISELVNDVQEQEEHTWKIIKGSNDPRDFADYLEQWPNGKYARVAERQIRRIDAESRRS